MKFLIVGLGNIGPDYAGTRHNVGFDVLDELAKKYDASFSLERLAFVCQLKIKGKSVTLIKPTTYVNLSGKAVRYYIQQLKIPYLRTLVVLDDLDLPLGKIRMKPKGNDGGHNGLKHIDAFLGTNRYPRLRFGIGNEYKKGRQVSYVLGQFDEEEQIEVSLKKEKAVQMIENFILAGINNAMNEFNE